MAYDHTPWVTQGVSTGLSIGTAALSAGAAISATTAAWLGPVGLVVGFGLGGLLGAWQESERNRSLFYQYKNERAEATRYLNRNIVNAQSLINRTRTSFDMTYGEGMYDQYDDLFQTIFNLPSGSQTVSDLLESLTISTTSGKVEHISNALSNMTRSALTGSLSLQDINAEYLNYMKQQIHTADTVLGLQFQANTARENQIVSAYFDSVEQYNLQLAQQFDQAFLQYRTENIQNEMLEGEAAVAQATSGMRQTGTGTNMTTMQQFQTDLANVAYASSLSYQIKAYELSMEATNRDLINEIYQIRNENAITTQQALEASVNQYNQARDEQREYYYNIKDYTEAIEEYNDEMREASSNVWGWSATEGYEELSPEELF